MWVVGPNYNEPVTLSGRDLRSGAPLWFDIYPSNDYHGYAANVGYHTHAVLDPSGPNRGYETYDNDNWNIWGIGIIVSAASCYELDVTWAGGSWRTIFAAGTVPLPTVAP